MELKLLLIDDDEIFILLSKKLIRTAQFHEDPLVFKNGQEAVQFLKTDYNSESAYLVFLDINMPLMNGWEFLEAIADFTLPDNVFVFMMSSSIDENDKKKAAQNEYILKFLSKPILLDTYLELKQTPELSSFY